MGTGGAAAADVAVEAAGVAATVGLAAMAVRKGGRVVLVGNLAPEVPLPLQVAVTGELELVGSCAIAGEYPEAVAVLAAGGIRVGPLVSGVYPLERGVEAFGAARRPGALKVLIA